MQPPSPIDEVHELNFAYRRFSNDAYAAQLTDLLEAHEIPYELMAEPEGVGSVMLGSVAIPGVIVMIRHTDVAQVRTLEGEVIPQAQRAKKPEDDVELEVSSGWIMLGYVFSLLGAPLAILAGLHLFTAKRRGSDMVPHYAYDASARRHGRLIFWFSLCIYIFSWARLLGGARMTFLDTFSFITWLLSHPL